MLPTIPEIAALHPSLLWKKMLWGELGAKFENRVI